ncbi:MAG: WD40/YVTN/BNR-like repeat-containing protein [Blastocatellia bacterium]
MIVFPRKTRLAAMFCAALLTLGALSFFKFQFAAEAQSAGQISDATFKTLQFRAIGPAIMGGRIDDFAVVESNPSTVFAATASGGLWRTVNNGTTWEPLFDNETVSSIGDVDIVQSNPDVIWAGTGEPNNRQSSSWGNGVYKSTDGGKSWMNVGLKDTHHIGRIVIDQKNPDTVYVAALGHLWGANKERGLYKTTDGGKTWTLAKFINEDTGFTDLAMDPNDPNTLYAAAYQRRRTAFGYQGGGPGSGLYKSTDAGATWAKLTNGLPAGDAGRIGLDIYRKDSKTVYAVYEHTAESGVYRSDDKGETWKKQSATNPRPAYYSQIRVDPTNDQRVYVLGAGWYVSDNGGKNFQANSFGRIHGDYHALWINPTNSNHLLTGTDGGIHFSYDKGRTWDYVNTIPLGQFYEVGFDFRKPYWVYGGLQDNGSWGAPAYTTNSTGVSNDEWIRVGGGDGFYCVVDPKDPNTVYTESQNAGINRLNLANGESKFIKPQPEEGSRERYRFDWNSPILISPHNNRRIYLGGNRLFISNDRGDNWTTVTPDLTKAISRDRLPIMGFDVKSNVLSGHDGQENYSHIVTIAESPVKEGVLWAGTDDGNVQVSRDGGKSWKNVTEKVPGVPVNTYVTRVIASHAAAGRAYVTFDGHRNNDFTPYVFSTEDFGETWKAITNGLPHPANVIREHHRNQNLLLAGTEFGLWVSFNRGAAWRQFKNNLPTVPVDDIQIHPRDNDLILATHGRSIWVLDDMTPLEQMTETIAAAEAHLFDTRPATMWRIYNHKGSTGHKTFIANNPPTGAVLSYHLREKAKDKVRVSVHDRSGALVREFTATNEVGIQRISWDCRHQSPLPGQSSGNSGFAGAFPRGPRVLPGAYTVKLIVDGKEVMSKPLIVEEDPRIQLSPADAKARIDFLLAVNKLQRTGTEGQNRVSALRSQLNSLLDNLKKQESKPQALIAAATKVLDEVIAVQNQLAPQINRIGMASEAAGPADAATLAAQDAAMRKIARLFDELDFYTEPVAAKHRAQLPKLTTTLNSLIEQINRLVTETVPNLNRQVEAAGLSPLKAGETIAPVQK